MNWALDTRVQTSRKVRGCASCCWPIQPGHLYERQVGVWEGDFYSIAVCASCAELWEDVVKRFQLREWTFDELDEWCLNTGHDDLAERWRLAEGEWRRP